MVVLGTLGRGIAGNLGACVVVLGTLGNLGLESCERDITSL